jgi:type IX secretion system PorP/SprF family membrane protein
MKKRLDKYSIATVRAKWIMCFILPWLVWESTSGQQVPVTDQYVLNPMIINPSMAGSRGIINVAAFYRRQWVGINGAPETLTLAADAPYFDTPLGFGVNILNDRIGVTNKTALNTQYSYKIDLDRGDLSFGIGAGLIFSKNKWSELTVIDPGDDAYLIDSKLFIVPDFSFGTYYHQENFFAGLSIPRLLNHTFNSDKNKYDLKADPGQYYYLLNSGYLHEISPILKFFPTILIWYSPGEKLLTDLNAHFNFYDRLWAGASLRSNRSIGSLFQFRLGDQLRFAYSLNYDFGKLRRYNNGSHEIMLRYEFRYKADVVNPLIF